MLDKGRAEPCIHRGCPEGKQLWGNRQQYMAGLERGAQVLAAQIGSGSKSKLSRNPQNPAKNYFQLGGTCSQSEACCPSAHHEPSCKVGTGGRERGWSSTFGSDIHCGSDGNRG